MKAVVVANWKMNPPTWREAKRLFEATRKAAERSPHSAVIVAPPSIFLRELSNGYRGKTISFALQHAHDELGGAHTGDISMAQGKDAGASYVLIGHAERRALGETDDDVRKKVAAALAARLTPVVCVGESERSSGGEHFDIVRRQLKTALADVPQTAVGRLYITYEPLWTIGKDTTMKPSDMHTMAIFLRKTAVELSGEASLRHAGAGFGPAKAGHNIKILYGGSVDAASAPLMLRDGDVRGFLVGRASTDARKFTELLQALETSH